MKSINQQINWDLVLGDVADLCEREYDVKLEIDRDVVREIGVQTEITLEALKMDTMPNVAKVAGHVAFWIRKLKPIIHASDSPHKLLTINEVVGILVGVGICRHYFDDHSRVPFNISKRVMQDWALSLRKHSHSPHSCAIAFEFLASEE
jgi:hypothetical protein